MIRRTLNLRKKKKRKKNLKNLLFKKWISIISEEKEEEKEEEEEEKEEEEITSYDDSTIIIEEEEEKEKEQEQEQEQEKINEEKFRDEPISKEEAERRAKLFISFRQINNFLFKEGIITFNFFGLTTEKIEKGNIIKLYANLIGINGIEENARKFICESQEMLIPK